MPADFLRQKGHPPHAKISQWSGGHVCRIFSFVILLIVILTLRFHIPYLPPGAQHVAARYQNIQETIPSLSSLNLLYSLVNSDFHKKQETIREILAIFDKYETGLARVTKEELAEVIYEEATRNNHDPKFILALIAIESSFQNWSVSEKGAKGLMQMMPYVAESVAQELGIEWSGDRTLFNPFLNIKMGVHYFSKLLLDFKDHGLALTAYNYGPTYVKSLIERKGKIPKDFYQKILSTYQDLLSSPDEEVSLPPNDREQIEIPT